MTEIIKRVWIVYIVLLSVFCNSLYSQETVQVKISKNKVSIDGELFYIHIVEAKQTLHSISKAYKVDINDIIKINSGVQYGLQINQAIKIPVNPIKKSKKDNAVIFKDSDNEYRTHITSPGETIYSISKQFNINQDTLLSLNPGLNNGLKAGMVLKLPLENHSDEGMNVVLEEKTIIHLVKKKENLISIANKYNVPVSAIIRKNKELLWGGVKEGQRIEITIVDTVLRSTEQLRYDTIDSIKHTDQYFRLLTNQDYYNLNEINIYKNDKSDTLDVTVLLPFNYIRIVELNDYIDTCKNRNKVRWAKKKRREVKVATDFYTDFYLGILMALDSIKNFNLPVKLNTYDTQGDSNVVRYLINKHDLINTDILIGPHLPSSINTVLDYLGNTDVKIVLPNSNIKNIDSYNNVFQVIPSEEARNEHLANFVSNQYDKNVILVSNDDTLSKKESLITKNRILRYNEYYNTLDSIVIKEIYYNDTMSASLNHALNPNIENLIVIISTDEAFISNIIRELYNVHQEYRISILGNPYWSQLLYSNNIDIKYLHNLNISYFTPFYCDYSRKNVVEFLEKFRKDFKSEPYFQLSGINPVLFGYDLCLYFLRSSLVNDNNKFKNRELLTDFEFFQKQSDGGFENIAVTFITYERDLSVINYKPYKIIAPEKDSLNAKY